MFFSAPKRKFQGPLGPLFNFKPPLGGGGSFPPKMGFKFCPTPPRGFGERDFLDHPRHQIWVFSKRFRGKPPPGGFGGPGHFPKEKGVGFRREEGSLRGPELEQPRERFGPKPTRPGGRVIAPEPREHRQVVRPGEHVDRVDLQQPEPAYDRCQRPPVGLAVRPGHA